MSKTQKVPCSRCKNGQIEEACRVCYGTGWTNPNWLPSRYNVREFEVRCSCKFGYIQYTCPDCQGKGEIEIPIP